MVPLRYLLMNNFKKILYNFDWKYKKIVQIFFPYIFCLKINSQMNTFRTFINIINNNI